MRHRLHNSLPRWHRRTICTLTGALVISGLGWLVAAYLLAPAGEPTPAPHLLAGTMFVLTVAVIYYSGALILLFCLLIGGAVFAAAFLWLRSAFRRASGGLSYRVGRLGS